MIKHEVNLPSFANEEPVITFVKGSSATAIEFQKNAIAHFVSELTYSNKFTIGQVFNAVARYHNKTPSDYGKKWVRYMGDNYEVTGEFKALKSIMDTMESDFEKVNLACKTLGEAEFKAEFLHEQESETTEDEE